MSQKSDLISREEVLRTIITAGECEPDLGYAHLHRVVENIPSADRPTVDKEYLIDLIQEAVYDGEACAKLIDLVDRPTGEWIWSPKDEDGTVSGCCSNCSFSHLFIGGHTAQYNYCPNCGAKMKGADDED